MEFPNEPGAPELAARTYDAAAQMVHGKCCTLNFPGEALTDEIDPERIRRKLVDAGWEEVSLSSQIEAERSSFVVNREVI